tara:strand:- start:4776 stop:4946 length:171 start_codon:yes stop_codon:yes gene_type:complete
MLHICLTENSPEALRALILSISSPDKAFGLPPFLPFSLALSTPAFTRSLIRALWRN